MQFAEPHSFHPRKMFRRVGGSVDALAFCVLLSVWMAPTAVAQNFEIVATYDASQPPNVLVQFELQTQENIAGYIWTFGDGGQSFDASPTHLYVAEGEFEVNVDLTTASGTNYNVTAPDLVVIHNLIFADDFDTLIDTSWDPEADLNQEPYGDGMAMGFWIHKGGGTNQQMPNGGIGVSNGSGSGGGDCIGEANCIPDDRGLFRFQVEVLPMGLPSGTQLTLFKLDGAEVEVQLRWLFGAVQARTEFNGVKTAWQTLGMAATKGPGLKGRFEIHFAQAGAQGGLLRDDSLDVHWLPEQGSGSLSWHSTTTGASVWTALTVGALEVSNSALGGGLDPDGQIWIDNFEMLRHSLGGVP